MSLGVGFGDIVKAISLAKHVVTTYRNAPAQVKEQADDISRLVGVLEGALIILQRREYGLAEYERSTLLSILQGYTTILNKFRAFYNENYTLAANESHGVGSCARKTAKRLVFGPDAIKEYRQEIVHYNAMLSSFLGLLNAPITWDTHQKIETLIEYKSTQEDQQLLAWLTQLDFGTRHSERLRRREPGTGTWFYISDQFQAWLDEPQTTLLCPGMPGAGKSFLASTAIEHLQQIYSNDRETNVTFLLCDFNSQQEQYPEDLLANLLKQLIQNRPIPMGLRELFVQYKSKPPGCRPLMNELIRCLNTAMALYERVFLVIDALDEHKTENRTRLLIEIFKLQKDFRLNVLATLRPIQELLSSFEESGPTLHVLEIRAREDDIHKFLDSKLKTNLHFLGRRPEQTRLMIQKEIKLNISQAADGMFLLAVLYLDSINRCRNLDYVRKSITELPKGPDAYGEIYCNTMVRIQSRETRYLAIQVLSWVAWSKRPLTARELQHALVITEGSMSLNEDNITDAEDLVSSCEGLVTLNSKTNTVGLVHSTTREYLETIRDTYFPSVENDVLFVCLELLSSPYFQKGACKTDAEFQERLRDYPLYDYASRYWGDHAGNTTGMEESLVAFLGDIPKVDAASQCQLTYRGRCQSVPFGVTGVHLAATYGLDTVVDSLLSSGCGADLRTSYGQSPLFFSVACGSQSTVAILLRHNAQVGAVDVFGRTALSFAAEFGQLEIAKNLSSQGARVDFKDGFGRSPLSDASEAGHEAMARYLLENFPNVQIDEKENSGRTPLWRAASKGHWGVVKLLAAHGANIDTHLQGGPTLVGWAVENGKRDALDNLIAMGANVNLTDGDGRTPLSHAAEEGSLFIVTTLLANGADSNLADEDGWSPLMWASDSGKHDVVSALLRHGHPHPNILEHTDRFGQTALSLASRAGHAVVVELLLGHDLQRTTVKMSDETGWTPLIQSAKHGSSKVLSLLLDKQGAAGNVVHCDCAGKTALHWAARLGHVAAMQTLLEGGAFIDATDNVGRTPLWYAVRNGHAEAVEVLLKANAATHVSDMLERTPLQLAIENGHDCIAEMLLGHGAELEASVGPQWVFLHISSLTASLLVREHAKRVSSKEGGEADVLGLGILFA